MKRHAILLGLLAGLWLSWSSALQAEPAAADVPGAAARFESQGKVLVDWPANSTSGAFDEKGRDEFCNTLIKVVESKAIHDRALERVQGLHPEVKLGIAQVKAVREVDTGIIKITATGEDLAFMKFFGNAVLDETLAFYWEISEKALGKVPEKIFEHVLANQKLIKAKEQERQAFIKAHPNDFEAGANKAVFDQLCTDLKHLSDENEPWLQSLKNINQFINTSTPRVVIIERAANAQKVPEK